MQPTVKFDRTLVAVLRDWLPEQAERNWSRSGGTWKGRRSDYPTDDDPEQQSH